jgi:hypothetical protein
MFYCTHIKFILEDFGTCAQIEDILAYIYRLYLCTKMAKYGSGYPTLVTINFAIKESMKQCKAEIFS